MARTIASLASTLAFSFCVMLSAATSRRSERMISPASSRPPACNRRLPENLVPSPPYNRSRDRGIRRVDSAVCHPVPLCPACDCDPACHASTVGNPVEYIRTAPYQLRALNSLNRHAQKSEENNQLCLVFPPAESCRGRQNGKCDGMDQLAIMREGHSQILPEPLRKNGEQESAGQRGKESNPCQDRI